MATILFPLGHCYKLQSETCLALSIEGGLKRTCQQGLKQRVKPQRTQ